MEISGRVTRVAGLVMEAVGLRLAVGARRRDIAAQFLGEALLLSVAAWVERTRPWRRTAPGFPD